MAFWKGGGKKRRDQTEAAIIQALRAVGAEVWQLSGRGVPDLLIRHRGTVVCLEIKTNTGKRTRSQQETQWPIARTPAEALAYVGIFYSDPQVGQPR